MNGDERSGGRKVVVLGAVGLVLVGVLAWYLLGDASGTTAGTRAPRVDTPNPAGPGPAAVTPPVAAKPPMVVVMKPFDAGREDPGAAGGRVTGFVGDDGGHPIADATVDLVLDTSPMVGTPAENRVVASARTDGGGTFAFEPSVLGTGDTYVVRASHPDYSVERYFPVDMTKPKTLTCTLTLHNGSQVVELPGTVRSVAGIAIAGAEVTLYDLRINTTHPEGAVERVTKSDAAGAFVLKNIKPGFKKVKVRATGFATNGRNPVNVESGRPGTALDFMLSPGQVISGLITAQDTGKGVEGAYVTARLLSLLTHPDPGKTADVAPFGGARGVAPLDRDSSTAQTLQQVVAPQVGQAGMETVLSTATGFYQFPGLEAGHYQITVSGRGFAAPPQQEADTGTENLNFALIINARIAGRVVDDETGKPIESFTVGPVHTPDAVAATYPQRRAYGPPKSKDGEFEYDDLAPGKIWLVADAPGYAGGRSGEINVRLGERTDGIEIRVARGATISGRIIDSKGRPVVDARVEAEVIPPGPINPFTAAFRNKARRDPKFASTDRDGRYRIATLMDGAYTITAAHPRHGPYTAPSTLQVGHSGETPVADIVMALGGTIRGGVKNKDGKPDATARVMVTPIAPAGAPNFGAFSARTIDTDSSGRFEASGLAAGNYRVAVMMRDGVMNAAEIFRPATGTAITYTVREDETLELDL